MGKRRKFKLQNNSRSVKRDEKTKVKKKFYNPMKIPAYKAFWYPDLWNKNSTHWPEHGSKKDTSCWNPAPTSLEKLYALANKIRTKCISQMEFTDKIYFGESSYGLKTKNLSHIMATIITEVEEGSALSNIIVLYNNNNAEYLKVVNESTLDYVKYDVKNYFSNIDTLTTWKVDGIVPIPPSLNTGLLIDNDGIQFKTNIFFDTGYSGEIRISSDLRNEMTIKNDIFLKINFKGKNSLNIHAIVKSKIVIDSRLNDNHIIVGYKTIKKLYECAHFMPIIIPPDPELKFIPYCGKDINIVLYNNKSATSGTHTFSFKFSSLDNTCFAENKTSLRMSNNVLKLGIFSKIKELESAKKCVFRYYSKDKKDTIYQPEQDVEQSEEITEEIVKIKLTAYVATIPKVAIICTKEGHKSSFVIEDIKVLVFNSKIDKDAEVVGGKIFMKFLAKKFGVFPHPNI